MRIWHYDRETGVLIGPGEAAADPLEHELVKKAAYDAIALPAIEAFTSLPPESDLLTAQAALEQAIADAKSAADGAPPQHWLIPAYATTLEPPEAPEGHVAVFREGAWAVDNVAADPEPPALTHEQLWARRRLLAQNLHADSDRVMMLFFEAGQPPPPEWVAYRRELRKIVLAESGDPTAQLPAAPAIPAELVDPA